MDPDSFLNLLSPELTNIDYNSLYYCDSSTRLEAMDEDEEEGQRDVMPLAQSHKPSLAQTHKPSIVPITPGPDHQLAPTFCCNKTISPMFSAINPGISIPSPPFASVLRLSDIACALEGFSQPAMNCLSATQTRHTSCHSQRHSYGSSGAQPSHHQNCDHHPLPPPSAKTYSTALPLLASHKLVNVNPDSGSDRDVKSFPVTSTHAPPPSPSYAQQTAGSGEKRPRLSPEASSRACASTDETDQKRPLSGNMSSREGMTPREVHIQSERQRRRSMTDHFATLQSLVPKLKLNHSDRITVLTEVITYIQSLRGTLDELEKKKTDLLSLFGLPPETHLCYDNPTSMTGVKKRSSKHRKGAGAVEVSVRMTGSDIFLTVNSPKKKGVWSKLLMLLHRYSIEVVNATLASSGDNNFHCIHGKMGSMSKITASDLQRRLEQLIWMELKGRPKL